MTAPKLCVHYKVILYSSRVAQQASITRLYNENATTEAKLKHNSVLELYRKRVYHNLVAPFPYCKKQNTSVYTGAVEPAPTSTLGQPLPCSTASRHPPLQTSSFLSCQVSFNLFLPLLHACHLCLQLYAYIQCIHTVLVVSQHLLSSSLIFSPFPSLLFHFSPSLRSLFHSPPPSFSMCQTPWCSPLPP